MSIVGKFLSAILLIALTVVGVALGIALFIIVGVVGVVVFALYTIANIFGGPISETTTHNIATAESRPGTYSLTTVEKRGGITVERHQQVTVTDPNLSDLFETIEQELDEMFHNSNGGENW